MTFKRGSGSRGRLVTAGGAQSKAFFKCVVESCNQTIRGDRITEHFRTKSKLEVLDEAKNMDVSGILTNGLKHIDSMCVDDETQNAHTKYLLSNGYSSNNLPNKKSPGFKKRINVELSAAFANSGFTATASKVKKPFRSLFY
jgi:hypothetical protein